MAHKLNRELSNRHIQLIAIGGAIGTGLFLGAGQSISLTGPSILLTYIIVGFVLFMFMRAMGEMLISNTQYKTFADIAHDQIGPLAGFLTGWTYWLTWITSGMAEITAVAKYVEYWLPELPNWITSLACILILMTLNLASTKMFGELEFWFSIIKVVTIIALIVVAGGITYGIYQHNKPLTDQEFKALEIDEQFYKAPAGHYVHLRKDDTTLYRTTWSAKKIKKYLIRKKKKRKWE